MTPPRPSHDHFRNILLLAALGLTLRLALFTFGPLNGEPRVLIDEDSLRYVILSENLLTHSQFAKLKEDGLMHKAIERLRAENGTLPPADALGMRAEGFRTPGYPLYLAAWRAFTNDLRWPVLGQCLMGAILVGFVVEIARKIAVKLGAAYAVGLFWACHPALLVHDNGIMTESLFNVLAISGLFVATQVRTWRGLLLAGFLIGASALVRPLGLLFLPAAAALAWPTLQRRWLALVILAVAAALPSVAWSARNAQAGFGFRVSTVGDLNHLFYTAAYVESESRGEDWLKSWKQRVQENESKLRSRIQPGDDVFTAARSLAFEELLSKPQLTAKVLAKSWVKLFLANSASMYAGLLGQEYESTGLFARYVLGETSDNAPPTNWPAALGVLAWTGINAMLVLLAAIGLGRWLIRGQLRLVVMTAVTISLFLIATGAVGLERFRLPILLPLLLAAAGAAGQRQCPEEEKS
jgi:hypothetical protein